MFFFTSYFHWEKKEKNWKALYTLGFLLLLLKTISALRRFGFSSLVMQTLQTLHYNYLFFLPNFGNLWSAGALTELSVTAS